MANEDSKTVTNDETAKNIADKAARAITEATATNPVKASLIMKQGNIILTKSLQFTAHDFGMCDEMLLVEVKPVYEYDANNKPILDKVCAINYTCVDGISWYNFKVLNQSKPIISQDEIDARRAAGNPVMVKIPLDKIVFKTYQNTGDRGIIRFSLQLPYIELL